MKGELWKTYPVRWDFKERVCGSVPQGKDLVRPWLEARNAPEEAEAEVLETIEEAQEKVTLGFQKDKTGLFIRGGTIKAHLKDSANQLKELLKIKNFRSKAANRIYIEEYRVYLTRDGKVLKKEDDKFDQAIHVMTPRGPRNSLKTIRFVERPTIHFTLKVLEDGVIKREHLGHLFDYGAIHGYGGERSMGEGRYAWTLFDGADPEETQ